MHFRAAEGGCQGMYVREQRRIGRNVPQPPSQQGRPAGNYRLPTRFLALAARDM
jgi:hypothetical protein